MYMYMDYQLLIGMHIQVHIYPLVNSLFDPENSLVLVETNLSTPMTPRVYVDLLEGNI